MLHQISKLYRRPQLLRVKTAAHPYAKVDLNLRKGRGMGKKYSYVGLKRYSIQVRTLGYYEHQVGEYCLTTHSLKKLNEKLLN